jgi:hypothetical protein
MTNVITNSLVDVHLSKAKPTSFLDSSCFLIASPVRDYSLWQRILMVLADETNS